MESLRGTGIQTNPKALPGARDPRRTVSLVGGFAIALTPCPACGSETTAKGDRAKQTWSWKLAYCKNCRGGAHYTQAMFTRYVEFVDTYGQPRTQPFNPVTGMNGTTWNTAFTIDRLPCYLTLMKYARNTFGRGTKLQDIYDLAKAKYRL